MQLYMSPDATYITQTINKEEIYDLVDISYSLCLYIDRRAVSLE